MYVSMYSYVYAKTYLRVVDGSEIIFPGIDYYALYYSSIAYDFIKGLVVWEAPGGIYFMLILPTDTNI